MLKFTVVFKAALIIIVSYLVASCATQKLSTKEIRSAHKIAILSELDDRMNKVFVGLTIFDDESSQSSAKVWNINHNIENDIAQKLWASGREVVILQSTVVDIMQEKKKIIINQSDYKGATLVILVKPIYQIDNYPMFPEGYGLFEKDTLGIKKRLLYASIIYEVYSAKDGYRKAYYVVHPKDSNVIKLNTDIPFKKISESEMLQYKPQIYALFDQVNTRALQEMGLI